MRLGDEVFGMLAILSELAAEDDIVAVRPEDSDQFRLVELFRGCNEIVGCLLSAGECFLAGRGDDRCRNGLWRGLRGRLLRGDGRNVRGTQDYRANRQQDRALYVRVNSFHGLCSTRRVPMVPSTTASAAPRSAATATETAAA